MQKTLLKNNIVLNSLVEQQPMKLIFIKKVKTISQLFD